MSGHEWFAVLAIAAVVLYLSNIARQVQKTNQLLETVINEIVFLNQDKREIERRERYPNLPY